MKSIMKCIYVVVWCQVFQHSFALYQNGFNIRSSDICSDPEYIPLHGSRTPSLEFGYTYHNGSRLRFSCDENYILQPENNVQTCIEGVWVPDAPPKCVPVVESCSGNIIVHNGVDWSEGDVKVGSIVPSTDIQCCDGYIPDPSIPFTTCTANGIWSNDLACIKNNLPSYCARPPSVTNGVILCCEDTGKYSNHSDYCCSSGGKVQFECNDGYAISSGQLELQCTSSNTWSPSFLPTCSRDPTEPSHLDQSTFSDGMIKTVGGVAAGVLALLLIVVGFAFCKPRLKEMKRRWMDVREDECGLIVDGRRVNLPSYEQATANAQQPGWANMYHQVDNIPSFNNLSSVAPPSSEVTRPPESNIVDFQDTPSTSYAPSISNEGHHAGPSNDHITVLEFLRELPSTSRATGFQNPPNPSMPPCRPSYLTCSSSSSFSSNDSVSAPLLIASSRATNQSSIKCNDAKKVVCKEQPTTDALNRNACESGSEDPQSTATSNEDGDNLSLNHIVVRDGDDVTAERSAHESSTTL